MQVVRENDFDAKQEAREEAIKKLKSDVVDRMEEAVDEIIKQAVATHESQSTTFVVKLKNSKGAWTAEVSARSCINHGKTTREAQIVGGQLNLLSPVA